MSLLTDLQEQIANIEAREQVELAAQPKPETKKPMATDAFGAGLRTIRSAFDSKGTDAKDLAYAYGMGAGGLQTLAGKGAGVLGRTLQSAEATPTKPTHDPISSGFMQVYAHTPKAPLAEGPKPDPSLAWQRLGKKIESYEKPLTAAGERTKAFYEPLLSDDARELKNTSWYKAEGLGAKVVSAALQASESAPQTAIMAVAGAPIAGTMKATGAVKGIATGLKRIGLNKKWAGNIATWLSEGFAFSTPEGLMAGLSSAEEVNKLIEAKPHEELMQSPKYVEYFNKIDSKITGEERVAKAKQLLYEDSELFAVGSTMAASIVTGMATGGGMFGSAGASKDFLMRRVLGAAKEGVQEFFQSGPGEKAPQNLAIQLFVDPDQEIMEGVWEAALAGAGPGALMGGVMGSGKPDSKSPIEVLERAQAERIAMRKKSLDTLKAKKVSDEDLTQMARSPEILAQYGLSIADVEAILTNRKQASIELANYQEMLDSAPTEAVRRGMMNSAQGLATQKLQQTMGFTETKIQEPEVMDDRKEAKQEARQAPQKKEEAPKVAAKPVEEPIAKTEIQAGLETAKKNVLDLYANFPTSLADADTQLEHAEKLKEAEDTVTYLEQELEAGAKEGKVERRVDTERRKTVDEMSTDEMRKELLLNPLTGIPNKRAITEVMQRAKEEGKPKTVIFLDADSLKTINDLGGHAAGDALLQSLADSISEVDPQLGGHISGDEFIILANDAKDAKIKTDKLDKILASKEIVFTLENGDEYTYSGLGASYGVADTIEAADRKMGLHKIEREKAGTRVGRGEAPPGLRKTAAGESEVSIDKGQKEEVKPEAKKPVKVTKTLSEIKALPSDSKQGKLIQKALVKGEKANLSYSGFSHEEVQDLKKRGFADTFGFMSPKQFAKWQKDPSFDPVQAQEKSVSTQTGTRSLTQLTRKETELKKREQEMTDLVAQGKRERAKKVLDYTKTETEAYLTDALDVPLVDRNLESLTLERDLRKREIQWMAKGEKKRASEKRLIELEESIKSYSKRSKTDLKSKKEKKEYISKPIEKSALNERLESELKSKNKELETARKKHKAVKRIRAEIRDIETKIAEANVAAVAARIEERDTTQSTTDQVAENMLQSLGLKKVPSIFEIVATYEDLPQEVKDALKTSDKALAATQGPRWTSKFKDDFIQAKGPKKASPANWLKTIQDWTTDKPTKKKDKLGNVIYKKGAMPAPVRDEVIFSGIIEHLENSAEIVLYKKDILEYLDKQGLEPEMRTQGYAPLSQIDYKAPEAGLLDHAEILADELTLISQWSLKAKDEKLAEAILKYDSGIDWATKEKQVRDLIWEHASEITKLPEGFHDSLEKVVQISERRFNDLKRVDSLREHVAQDTSVQKLRVDTFNIDEDILDICRRDFYLSRVDADTLAGSIVKFNTSSSLSWDDNRRSVLDRKIREHINVTGKLTVNELNDRIQSIIKLKDKQQVLKDEIDLLQDMQGLSSDISDEAQWSTMVLDGLAEHYREHLVSIPYSVNTLARDTFSTGHFETNDFLHLRADIRKGAETQKLFFINEVQSDWHQQGSQYGYSERDEAATKPNQVPWAPFRTTWKQLGLKRAVMQAVVEGQDYVAFSATPDQVANIEQWGTIANKNQDGNIVYLPGELGSKGSWIVFEAYDSSGNDLLRPETELLSLATYKREAKKTADRIHNNNIPESERTAWENEVMDYWENNTLGSYNVTTIIDFYTKALPKIANKLFKKYKTKMESIELEEGQKVQGFKITPELKQAAENGMPMNMLEGDKPAGVYYKGKIYLIAENIDPAKDIKGLLVHEAGHFLRANDPAFQKVYKQMLDQVQSIARGNRTPAEAEAMQKAMQKAMQESNRLSPELLEEEALMYFLMDQANVELPWYKKIVSTIKQFLFKHLGLSPKFLNMSGYDFAQIIANSIKKGLETKMSYSLLVGSSPMTATVEGAKTVHESNEPDRAFFRDMFNATEVKLPETNDAQLKAVENEVIQEGKKSKDSAVSKLALTLDKLNVNKTAFKRTASTQTTGLFERIFGLPEYSYMKNEAANRVMQIALKADDLKYTTQSDITVLFNETVEGIKQSNLKEYEWAGEYLRGLDKTGIGFSIKKTDKSWNVLDKKNKLVEAYKTDAEATQGLMQHEQDDLAADNVSKEARTVIYEFRKLTNRAFDAQIKDLQSQIDNAKRYGLEEPHIAGPESPTIADAIAQIGDRRGTYFPRERQNKTYVVRASKKGENNVLLTFDAYLPENDQNWDTTNQIKGVLNANLPIGKKITELQDKGYTVEGPTLGATPAEEIFDVPGLVSSMDALLKLAEDSSADTDKEAMQQLNRILTKKIAEIYKQKGTLSSRLTRAKDYTEGFETDLIKAATSHAQRVSSGVVKRKIARDMILAFTGRDISYTEYTHMYPAADYAGYRKFVADRKIDPTSQKELYADIKQYIFYTLKPDTTADRAMGYLKAMAVMKYLGFRVSSAAVNVTNMFMAVPATISAHTGQSLTQSTKDIATSSALYTAYRSEQLVFKGESNSAIAKTNTFIEEKLKRAGTAVTRAAKVDLTDADYDIFDKISELGWDQAHFNIEATRALQGYAGSKFNNFLAANMYMFGAAEKANRAITIFAAYKAQMRANPNMSKMDALNAAKHTSDRAHGIYGKAAKPWIVQHFKPADLFYTFLKFQHNYLLNMIEMGVKYKNPKAVLQMLIMPAVLSGAGASLATPLVMGLLKLFGFSEDPEEDMYHWAEMNLPDLVNQFPRHGIFGLANLNFKGSLQMNNPFPTKLSEMPGAPGAVLTDLWEAGKHFRYGAYSKGLEKLAPTALATPVKAVRLATEGITSSSYAPIYYGQEQMKASATEVAAMMLSFNTAKLSGAREKQWRESQVRESFTRDYQKIMKRLKHIYIKSGTITAEDMANVQEDIDDYNFRVERAASRYHIKYLTGERIARNLRQAFKPSAYERVRGE